MTKERLDILIQQRFNLTRSKAQGLIRTGEVYVDGERIQKPALRYTEDAVITINEQPRFVSRGGDKLEGAFEKFPVRVEGQVTMDVGASTGGFTDCLLQHGASKIYAVDVGYGQLAWKLRQDPRVVVLERCNIRHLKPEQLQEPPTFFTADCSFISLRLILAPIVALLGPNPEGIVLIKPQFEAGKQQVGKGGVVRDVLVHEQVIQDVTDTARKLGFQAIDVVPSPLTGPAGNREFLAYLHNFQAPPDNPSPVLNRNQDVSS